MTTSTLRASTSGMRSGQSTTRRAWPIPACRAQRGAPEGQPTSATATLRTPHGTVPTTLSPQPPCSTPIPQRQSLTPQTPHTPTLSTFNTPPIAQTPAKTPRGTTAPYPPTCLPTVPKTASSTSIRTRSEVSKPLGALHFAARNLKQSRACVRSWERK